MVYKKGYAERIPIGGERVKVVLVGYRLIGFRFLKITMVIVGRSFALLVGPFRAASVSPLIQLITSRK